MIVYLLLSIVITIPTVLYTMNSIEKVKRININQDEKAFISSCVNEYLLDVNTVHTRSAADRLDNMIKHADVTDAMITYVQHKPR